MGKEIGGLLRFAPGRLGARKPRAPSWCGIRRRVVSWLPCATPGDELDTEARIVRVSAAVTTGMATGSAKRRGSSAVAG